MMIIITMDEMSFLPNASIGHIHLHVSNLAKAKKFYHDILELNHTATYPGAYFFAANRYHHHVATNTLARRKHFSLQINDNNKPGLDHYAINLPSQNDLLFIKNRLLEYKIKIYEEQQIENDNLYISSFYAYDSDGIKIQFLYNN